MIKSNVKLEENTLPLNYSLTYSLIKEICAMSNENETFHHIGYTLLRHRAINFKDKHSHRHIENKFQSWNTSLKACYQRQPKINNHDDNKFVKVRKKSVSLKNSITAQEKK